MSQFQVCLIDAVKGGCGEHNFAKQGAAFYENCDYVFDELRNFIAQIASFPFPQ
jgi:hypothetical protein